MAEINLLKEMTESQRQFVYFGMELERERIIKILDKYLGHVDFDELLEIINGKKNG